MKLFLYKITFLAFIIFVNIHVNAQDKSNNNCSDLLNEGYVSDGQEYIAKLAENNVAKFYCTFYGGSQYRIIACTDITTSPLILTVYDTEKNLLFCNKDYDYTPFWNFIFTSTIDCIVEIEFDTEKWIKKEVKLLIGFKEK
ncbi:MAG: hypothetical protein JEY96_06620 [Bacteroidales bacterium]|nr:hypothetical protein [Bacteroidales bacterium]